SGDLPVLRRLLGASAAGEVETGSRQFPDAAFYAAYTGLGPSRLGRYFFIQPRDDQAGLRLVGEAIPHGEPFWVTASRHGRRCIAVDTPKCHFAPPRDGIHVTGWGAHGFHTALRVAPAALERDFIARYGHYPLPNCDDHGRSRRSYRRLRDGLLAGVAARRRLLLDLATASEWDLFLAVFSETHCAGHNLWHLHDPTHPQYRAAVEIGDGLRDVYVAVDAAIGALIAAVGAETRVVLFSSQGMRPQYHGRELIPSLLRLWGMGEPQDRAPQPEGESRQSAHVPLLKRLRDAVPLPLQYAVKRRLPLALSDALLCRLVGAAALDVEARAYQVPNNEMTPALRINLAGRDPRGRVRPGREYEALRDFLGARLGELINPATGRAALDDVTLTDERYPGPYRSVLPDVTGYWSPAAPIEALYSPGYGTVVGAHRDYRTGGHGPEGFLSISGATGRLAAAHIADVAPTVLELLGVPVPPDLDGRSALSR
ncbi:MAG: alkaline phosphatase family protein, partial [bacterium]